MTSTASVATLQDVEQQAPTPDGPINEAIESRLKNLHTLLPGIIESFDPDLQTCKVQPALQRIFIEKGAVNLPVCVDVPVCFPGGGGFHLTFPIKPGDECTLSFSERCIDYWFENGGIQLPAEYRLHDYSDAFATVGVNSKPHKLSSFNVMGTELRNRARTQRITINADANITCANLMGAWVLSAAGKFTINAPGGFEVNTTVATINATTSNTSNTPIDTTNAPAIALNGQQTSGVGTAAPGSKAIINMPVEINDTLKTTGDANIGGKPYLPHTHNEHGTGGGVTDPPN